MTNSLADRLHAWYYHTEGDTDMELLEDEVRAIEEQLMQLHEGLALVEQENLALKRAIQNTLDTGMDRYIFWRL
jgi:hypothetical protein